MFLTYLKNFLKKKRRFILYCIGGGTAFLIDFGFLYFFTEKVQLWYILSATLSFAISVVYNYFWQSFFTFKSEGQRGRREFVLFVSAQIIGLIINNTILYISVEWLVLYYLIAKGIAAVVVLFWNFWINKALIFNEKSNDKIKKIVIAGEIFPPEIGGPATYTYKLVEYLNSRDDLSFVLLHYGDQKNIAKSDFLNDENRVVISNKMPWFVKYICYTIRLFRVARYMDAIYAQGPVSSGWPAMFVSILLNKKFVVKVVGDYSWEMARLSGATNSTIDEWQEKRIIKAVFLKKMKIGFIAGVQSRVMKVADRIITPSHYLKKIVVGWGADKSKVEVVYNSVDPILKKNEKNAKVAGSQKNDDVLLTVARLVNWKGIDMLIDIFPEIQNINPNFRLVIVGGGPEYETLKKIIKEKDLEKDIILTGRLSREDTAEWYKRAKIFLLNSSYEGLPHVVLEAMYYKLPVIVSESGGNSEIVQDAYNGILLPYNDKKLWVEAIKDLWHDKEKMERFCEHPLANMDTFKFETMIDNTMRVVLY